MASCVYCGQSVEPLPVRVGSGYVIRYRSRNYRLSCGQTEERHSVSVIPSDPRTALESPVSPDQVWVDRNYPLADSEALETILEPIDLDTLSLDWPSV